jgi:hypothetical protein
MTVSERLTQTWSAVLAEAPQGAGYYHRRIPVPAAWPTHAGIRRPTNDRLLIFEAETEALRGLHLRDETKGYSIEVAPDEAGRSDRAAIRIQETAWQYREIFAIFCTDLLEHWIPHSSASDALKSLTRRLACWKRFFQRGTQLLLSREDYVGLYGELSFIEVGLSAGVQPMPLISAWQAPLSANQDFLFGPLAIEIKTTTANEADNIRITNARQLDSTGLEHLFLARYAFDFRQGAGRTLPQLVAALKTQLSTASPEASALLADRLLDAGFVEAVPHDLDTWGFTPRQFDIFRVADGFPRLLESDLPHGISEPSYTLNLSAATPYKTAAAELWPSVAVTYA